MGNRMSKYHAKKCEYCGITFDSKRERDRFIYLKEQETLGNITDLKRQVPFTLAEAQKLPTPYIQKIKGGKTRIVKTLSAVKYVADFTYLRDGELVVEDAKGMKLDTYQLKKKWMLQKYNIQIMEV